MGELLVRLLEYMESLKEVIKDPVISRFLRRFPKDEWNRVILQTLKLGIHSMNTLENLTEINSSPKKQLKKLEIEICHEDDSTDFVHDSIIKPEITTPSVNDLPKIKRNDSKLPQKKKKTLSQVNKNTISRTTPKSKKSKIEYSKDQKNTTRIHSLKTKKRHRLVNDAEKKYELEVQEGVKSLKSLKKKVAGLNSPKNSIIRSGLMKGSLGMIDFQELYKESVPDSGPKIEFPLKLSKNLGSDPYQYITSSSDESP